MLVVCLLVAACTGSDPAPVGHDETSEETSGPRLPSLSVHGAGEGTIWLLAGPEPISANVFRIAAGTGQVRQVTSNPKGHGISWLSASKAGVVVADARTGTDRVGMLSQTGQVTPIHTGDPDTTRAFTPALAPDGTVAFARAVYPLESGVPMVPGSSSGSVAPSPGRVAPVWELVVAPPGSGPVTVVHHGDTDVAAPAWGPGMALAFVESPGTHDPGVRPQVLIQRDRSAPVVRFDVALDKVGSLAWGPHEAVPLAVTDGERATVLLDLETRTQRRLPAGWVGLCWSPHGRQLLVARGADLGLVAADKPTQVVEVGRLDVGSAFGCGWVGE